MMNGVNTDHWEKKTCENTLMEELPPLPAAEKLSAFYGRWASLIFVVITYGFMFISYGLAWLSASIFESSFQAMHFNPAFIAGAIIAGVFSVYPKSFGIVHLGQARQKISIYLWRIGATAGVAYVVLTIGMLVMMGARSLSLSTFVYSLIVAIDIYFLSMLIMLTWTYRNHGRHNTIFVWGGFIGFVVIVGIAYAGMIEQFMAVQSGASGRPDGISPSVTLVWIGLAIITAVSVVSLILAVRDDGTHPMTPSMNSL